MAVESLLPPLPALMCAPAGISARYLRELLPADPPPSLLADAGIIRNRLKVNAAIVNAKALQGIRTSHGSFNQWLAAHHPLDKPDWLRLFKQNFVFVGGEIVGEFLMSTGWLPGAHIPGCPAGDRAREAGAAWSRDQPAPRG